MATLICTNHATREITLREVPPVQDIGGTLIDPVRLPIADPDRLHELLQRLTFAECEDREGVSRLIGDVRSALGWQTLQGSMPPPSGDAWQDRPALAAFIESEIVHPMRQRARAEFAASILEPLRNAARSTASPELIVGRLERYRIVVGLDLKACLASLPLPGKPRWTTRDDWTSTVPESIHASIREHVTHCDRLIEVVRVEALGPTQVLPVPGTPNSISPTCRTPFVSRAFIAKVLGISSDVVRGLVESGKLTESKQSQERRAYDFLQLRDRTGRSVGELENALAQFGKNQAELDVFFASWHDGE